MWEQILTDTATPGQSEPGSNWNEEVFNVLQISRIGASLSGAIYCHTQTPTFLVGSYITAGDTTSVFQALSKEQSLSHDFCQSLLNQEMSILTFNHTMLTHLTPAAYLAVSKFSTHLWQSRPKLTWSDQILKTQLPASTVEPQLPFFQNPKILRNISSGNDVIHQLSSLQCPVRPHFLSRSLSYWWWLSYPFRTGMRVHRLTIDIWIKRHRVVQSLRKLNNKI